MEFKKIGSYGNGMTMYAKFTGYLDCIQYYFKLSNGDKTPLQTIQYSQLDMFRKLYQEMNKDLFKEDIKVDWGMLLKINEGE